MTDARENNGARQGGFMRTTHATAIVALFMMFFAGSVPATTATVNYNDLWWD
jgi:hypothetical protein